MIKNQDNHRHKASVWESMDLRSHVFTASRDGKIKKLKLLLEKYTETEIKNVIGSKANGGATPLVIASKNGHLDIVRFLLEYGADIEQVGNVQFDGETIEGSPPLWCAAAAGHLNIVRFLVEAGAQVNSTTRTKSTPLRAACYDGHLEIVHYLVKNGADVEIANRHGHTCLMIACYKGHYKIARFLIQYGADVNRKSIKGNTALHDCAESGSLEIMELLLSKRAIMATDSYGVTPLIAAALTGHSQIVELIISDYPFNNHGQSNNNGYSSGRSSPGSQSSINGTSVHGQSTSGVCFDDVCDKDDETSASDSDDDGDDEDNEEAEDEEQEEVCEEASGSTSSSSIGRVGQLVGQVVRKVKGHVGQAGAGCALSRGQIRIKLPSSGHQSKKSGIKLSSSSSKKDVQQNQQQQQLVTKQEKIDALQLLGATFVDKKRDMMAALEYWRRAIRERNTGPSELLMKPPTRCPNEAYNSAVEVMTETHLEELFSDPDDMRMQALLVRERILGPAHPDTSYYIRYRGAVYADTGNFDRCIKLWMYALDMQTKVLDSLNPMIQSSLLSFAELFSFMMSKGVATVKFSDLFQVFKRSLIQLKSSTKGLNPTAKLMIGDHENSNYHRTLIIILHFIGLICRLNAHMDTDEQMMFKRTLYKFVQSNPRGKNHKTPLHLACGRDSSYQSLRFPLCDFPMPEMVKVLIDVGACVQDVDNQMNTPLHDASNYKPFKKQIFKLLLENGAHLDVKNLRGETPFALYRLNAPIPVVEASLLEAVRAIGGLHPDPMGPNGPPSMAAASNVNVNGQNNSNNSTTNQSSASSNHSTPSTSSSSPSCPGQGIPSSLSQSSSAAVASVAAAGPAIAAPLVNNNINPREVLREKLQSLYPLKYVSLQCLAAQIIVKSNINYQELLPEPLARFVSLH